MPDWTIERRAMLRGAALAGAAALVPACATTRAPELDLVAILRDLLGLSAQRAFARLVADGGFLDDALARIEVPEALGGDAATGVAALLLRSEPLQRRLLKQVNRAAGVAAKAAAPIVEDAIGSLTVADAAAVLRGGPTAATDLLAAAIGASLGTPLVPAAAEGLGFGDTEIVRQALQVATGIDVAGIAADVGPKAARSIFRAIGREEAAIRADPASTGNPGIIAALTPGR
jgi:Protein of unknown function (DUF4197)